MAVHRFRDLLTSPAAPSPSEAAPAGFVPCPVPVFQLLTPDQQQYVVELYRLAREQVQAQQQAPNRPSFSLN